MKRIVYFLVSLLGFTKLAAQDPADFVLPSIISDHAVMQRDAEVKLWGWCPSVWDLKIVCSWAPNDTVHVSSDKYKYWETYVNTPKAEGPYTIQFYGWEGKLCAEVKDILMGETWLCSGQSNMEYCFKWRVDDITDRSTLFDNKKIRFFKVAKSSSAYPVERIQGKWEICSPETAEDFSVVAFCFGKKLNEGLGNLPVGLIGSYWGGTAIEPWIDEFTLRHVKQGVLLKAADDNDLKRGFGALLRYFNTGVDGVKLIDVQFEKLGIPHDLQRAIKTDLSKSNTDEAFGASKT